MGVDCTTIAKHGGLDWAAASEAAGPYYLANRWQIFASFGSRSLAAGEPGSAAQREAFEVSRAAFEACRLVLDPECYNATEIRSVVKLATAAARAEWKRWASTINRVGGAAALNGFQAAVLERLIKKMK